MTDDATPDPVASFKAHGQDVCLWSEKFGVEIWIVPELTGKDRIEWSAVEMHKFGLCMETLGGELLQLTTKDGAVLKPVPEWQERVRRRHLLDQQIQYDILLEREKGLRRKIDDHATPKAERDRLLAKWEREVEELDRLIEAIREYGHEMTDEEIRDGFEVTLRAKLLPVLGARQAGADEGCRPASPSPSPSRGALSTGAGALTAERARELLRSER